MCLLTPVIRPWSKARHELVDLMLVSPAGKIVYVTNDAHAAGDLDHALPDPDDKAFAEGTKAVYFTDVFHNKAESGELGMLVTAPAYGVDGEFIGVIALEIDMNPIYESIQDQSGLGETGETLIAKQVDDELLFLSPLRHDAQAVLTKRVSFGGDAALPMQEALLGREGSGTATDYRGEKVIAA